MAIEFIELLAFSVQHKASDLHLSSGLSPMMRMDGDLIQIDSAVLAHQQILKFIHGIMNEKQRDEFAEQFQIDFSFEINKLSRFRVNVFMHSRGVGVVFRIIPSTVLSLEDLNLPPVLAEITNYSNGLVLVTGPTGSGKSTTLAAMIEYINLSRSDHILTIEDPVELVYQSKKCLIHQREVPRDSKSMHAALHSALREDPDVILIGELRDLATIRLALTAAETGHLVFASLHTNSATKTINRMVDVFPAEEKNLVRSMLAESLQAVIAQTLVKKIGGGRVAALEIMICTAAIRNLIRENKLAQMYSSIQTGNAHGMQTLDQHLIKLVHNNVITKEVAREAHCH